LLTGSEPCLGILLQYPGSADPAQRTIPLPAAPASASFAPVAAPLLSVIGAGNYASRILIPAFARAGARFHTLAASSGLGPSQLGPRHRFRQASTDIAATIADPAAQALVIATRHDSHAALVQQALAAGKHVFVEKPLCLTTAELEAIEASIAQSSGLLMVGFNRRFAPLLLDLRQQLSRLPGPRAFVYTCNAGAIPAEHWTQDPERGGGRLLGEACHFVDLLRHLAGSPIEQLQLLAAADSKPCPDTLTLSLRFADGSIGTVHYLANGSKAFPKERLEVFAAGRVLRLDNYRTLKAWGIPGFRTRRRLAQDKGQLACCSAFLEAIRSGGPAPIPAAELLEVQRWLLQAVNRP
jgi:predicted dehydrogenase